VDLSGKPEDETAEGGGAFVELREPLRRLLKLSWDEDRWAIDSAHWEGLFLGKTRQQIFGEVKELLAARGIELPKLERDRPRFFGLRGEGWAPPNEQPHVIYLFENLKTYLQPGSSSIQNRGDRRLHSVGGNVEVNLVYNDNSGLFEFRISEFEGEQRTLVVRQEDEGRLHVVILGGRVVRIDQDPSGEITVLDSSADRNRRFRERSAATLSEKHADYLRDELFPLLDEMGIVVSSLR
jgi:hypothetical protein